VNRQPVFLKTRRTHVCGEIILLLTLAAMLVAAGCSGEQAGNEKNASGNLTLQNLGMVTVRPTHAVLRTTITSYSGSIPMPDMEVRNFSMLLVSWNDKMHWNLSPEQIDQYSDSMEKGVLKKYQTNPDRPHTLYIQDRNQFYYETGIALGFTTEESEEFVRAFDKYRREEWAMSDCRDFANNKPCPRWTITMNFTVQPRPLVTTP